MPDREWDAARVVPCRDERGRRRRLTVGLDVDRVLVGRPETGWCVLTPLQAGRLRGALREVVADGGC
ncbi:hypothetical protein [Saccharomonospora halophila]|uniref:hypothetical protein n=1 Tax=Saccharomonospora halophila TaxID=129922 RepID=UPI0003642439|nr:hypothetical protein [Saccharomonospora halophila]